MKTHFAVALACAAFVVPVFGAEDAPGCPHDASTAGMHARMKTVREQMDRIEWTTDRTEQRRLMDINMKHVQEGLRELRKRPIPTSCKVEMMDTMLETMARHQQVALESSGR